MDGTNFKAKLTERQRGLTVKMLALGFGLLSFALVFVVPFMGGLAPVAIALSSFFSGALFGLFLLGMFVPFANAVVSIAPGHSGPRLALSGSTVVPAGLRPGQGRAWVTANARRGHQTLTTPRRLLAGCLRRPGVRYRRGGLADHRGAGGHGGGADRQPHPAPVHHWLPSQLYRGSPLAVRHLQVQYEHQQNNPRLSIPRACLPHMNMEY